MLAQEGSFPLGDSKHSEWSKNDQLAGQNLNFYLDIARRRRILILACVVGLSVAATVMARRLPDIYRARTVILVDPQQVPDKYVPATVTANIADRLTTLQQQVLSPTRLKKLVEAEHLYPDPSGTKTEEQVIKSVQKSITVEVTNPGGPKMGSFTITYSSRKREQVARMANQIAAMFIQENQNARVEQTEGTRDFLQSRLNDTKRQLDEKESMLRAIKTHNILDLPESKPYHMEALANLRGQIQGIQDKITQNQREKSLLQSMLASGNAAAPTIDVEGGPDAPSDGSPTQTQIRRLETKLAELRTHYGPGHPDVKKTQTELKRLMALAATEEKGETPKADLKPALQPGTIKRRNPVVEAQMEKLNDEIRDLEKQLQPLQAKLQFHTSKLEQLPVFEQQMSGLMRDYEILKTQYTGLLDKKLAAEMSTALEIHEKGERFVILDSAITPEQPAAPNRLLLSLAGLFGGLIGGIGLAIAVEMNDETVRTENEAAKIFGKSVLAGIPRIISKREHRAQQLRTLGLLAGTVAGASALGLLLSMVAGELL
jgi:succinoglycan biosynthesis transport protein ExoP